MPSWYAAHTQRTVPAARAVDEPGDESADENVHETGAGVSLIAVATQLAGAAVVMEGDGQGDTSFVSPGTSDFYWPLIGGDNDWAFTSGGRSPPSQ